MADKESPFRSIYTKRRSVKAPQAFVDNRSIERIITLRILYFMAGLVAPWVTFPVFMIIKDHRPGDSKAMIVGTVLGMIYLAYYILFDMILYHPNW